MLTPGAPPRLRRRCSAAALAASAALIAACAGALSERVPLPRFPQAEQASEVVRGERLAAHRVCTGTAKLAEELIQCMQGRGYTFIARGPGYPATECWEIRDAEPGERLPPPHCFQRTRPPE